MSVDVNRMSPAEAKRAAAYLKLASLEKIYAVDCWRWMKDQVITIDEASQEKRPFPDMDYLHDIVDVLVDPDQRLIAIAKSRRMFVTWLLSIWGCWITRYHEHHAMLWQSQNEAKAAYVLDKRMTFVEDNLATPQLRRKYKTIRTTQGLIGRLTYEHSGSWTQAVPQGPDVFRSYTPSLLVIDECDFQPEAPLALAAAMPLAEKGVKLVIVSTSNGPGGPLAMLCREVGFVRYE